MLKPWFDTLEAFTVTLRNLGRPRVTEPLPWKKDRVHPERYRQTLGLTRDEHGEIACIACSACEKICPSQIIRVKSAGRKDSPVTGKKRAYPETFAIDLNACMFCEMCVQVCPADAITMLAHHQPSSFDREELVLTMDKLLENATRFTPSWASASRLAEMQDPKRGAAPATSPEGEKTP